MSDDAGGNELTVSGSSLDQAGIKLVNKNDGVTITPTSYTESSYMVQVPQAGGILQLIIGGEVWVTMYAST